MRQNTTTVSSGVVGNSQGANTTVTFQSFPPGRYRIWGHCRHSLVDGIKFSSPSGLNGIILSDGPNAVVNFGPIVVDLVAASTNVSLVLNTATGASDTASATLYVESINH